MMRAEPMTPSSVFVAFSVIEPSLHAHNFRVDEGGRNANLDDYIRTQGMTPGVMAHVVNQVGAPRIVLSMPARCPIHASRSLPTHSVCSCTPGLEGGADKAGDHASA